VAVDDGPEAAEATGAGVDGWVVLVAAAACKSPDAAASGPLHTATVAAMAQSAPAAMALPRNFLIPALSSGDV
jgi:hypothetical protein